MYLGLSHVHPVTFCRVIHAFLCILSVICHRFLQKSDTVDVTSRQSLPTLTFLCFATFENGKKPVKTVKLFDLQNFKIKATARDVDAFENR